MKIFFVLIFTDGILGDVFSIKKDFNHLKKFDWHTNLNQKGIRGNLNVHNRNKRSYNQMEKPMLFHNKEESIFSHEYINIFRTPKIINSENGDINHKTLLSTNPRRKRQYMNNINRRNVPPTHQVYLEKIGSQIVNEIHPPNEILELYNNSKLLFNEEYDENNKKSLTKFLLNLIKNHSKHFNDLSETKYNNTKEINKSNDTISDLYNLNNYENDTNLELDMEPRVEKQVKEYNSSQSADKPLNTNKEIENKTQNNNVTENLPTENFHLNVGKLILFLKKPSDIPNLMALHYWIYADEMKFKVLDINRETGEIVYKIYKNENAIFKKDKKKFSFEHVHSTDINFDFIDQFYSKMGKIFISGHQAEIFDMGFNPELFILINYRVGDIEEKHWELISSTNRKTSTETKLNEDLNQSNQSLDDSNEKNNVLTYYSQNNETLKETFSENKVLNNSPTLPDKLEQDGLTLYSLNKDNSTNNITDFITPEEINSNNQFDNQEEDYCLVSETMCSYWCHQNGMGKGKCSSIGPGRNNCQCVEDEKSMEQISGRNSFHPFHYYKSYSNYNSEENVENTNFAENINQLKANDGSNNGGAEGNKGQDVGEPPKNKKSWDGILNPCFIALIKKIF